MYHVGNFYSNSQRKSRECNQKKKKIEEGIPIQKAGPFPEGASQLTTIEWGTF